MVNRMSRYIGILVVALSLALPAGLFTDAVAQEGFPLTAHTAYCDPGYLGPFVACTPWERVVVSFDAVDQDFSQSCVTVPGERTASCTVNVPFGATIVASINPGAVPVGYVLEGPSSLEFVIPDGPPEGEFGGPAFVLLPALNEPPIEEAPVVEVPAAGGFPLSASTAYCQPGYLGPFVGCEPWQGVTVSFTTTDGAFSTSCVTSGTERAAGCVVEVPFGSTVIASIDPAAVPAGYVLEGPAVLEIVVPGGPPEGEFGGAAFVLLPASQDTTVTAAPVEAGGLPAGLYTGTCVGLPAGEPVSQLTNVRVPAGMQVGAPGAVPVATSYTVINVPFDDLLDGAHVIAISDPMEPDRLLVACGTIGGVPDENGSLAVGIQPMSGTGTAGVAYISAGDNGSSVVSIFIGDMMAAPVPGAVGASETTVRSGEWPSGLAQLKANYYGCPLETDMTASAAVLSDVCMEAVGGSRFTLQEKDGAVTDIVISNASPSGFWISRIDPNDYILSMWPIPKKSAVFCEGSTLSQVSLSYGKMEVSPYDVSGSQEEGVELSLATGESAECDWFVLVPDTGTVVARSLMCPAGWIAEDKSFDQMTSECTVPDEQGVPIKHELTAGGDGALAKGWGYQATSFDNVIPGNVTIMQTVQGGYNVEAVVCRNELRGLSGSPWNSGPYYQATITGENSVTTQVEAGDVLTCWFFNVPANSGVVPVNGEAATLAAGTEPRRG